MTDKDRFIRNERVKLRWDRRHQQDLDKIASLERMIATQRTRIQELLHELEVMKTEVLEVMKTEVAAVRREYGWQKKAQEPT
jgi:predicted RNase H-like nuclease (RuvC/YqgF family)